MSLGEDKKKLKFASWPFCFSVVQMAHFMILVVNEAKNYYRTGVSELFL